MKNRHPERRPPAVELLHPLVHDSGWTHDDGGPQAGVPVHRGEGDMQIYVKLRPIEMLMGDNKGVNQRKGEARRG